MRTVFSFIVLPILRILTNIILIVISVSSDAKKEYWITFVRVICTSPLLKFLIGEESLKYFEFLINLSNSFVELGNRNNCILTVKETVIYCKNLMRLRHIEQSGKKNEYIFGCVIHLQRFMLSYLDDLSKQDEAFVKQCFEFRLFVKSNYRGIPHVKTTPTIAYEDLVKKLQKNEAIIEIYRFRNLKSTKPDEFSYCFFILTSESTTIPKYLILNNVKELDGPNHKEYLGSMRKKSVDFNSFNIYWKHIHDVIPDKDKIYISPDSTYRYINLSTLYTENGQYLLEDKEIILCENIFNICSAQHQQKNYPHKAVLLGNPLFYNSDADERYNNVRKFLKPLPFTEQEIKKSAEILSNAGWVTSIYIGDEVTKKKLMETSGIGLLHLATHGYFQGIPRGEPTVDDRLFSLRLYLSHSVQTSKEDDKIALNPDGFLSGKDILHLDLKTVELVILSACESGVGVQTNTGEYFGFHNMFFQAGASVVIESLWSIEDEISMEFITSFYNHWVKDYDNQKAFRNAQMQLKLKYRHPYYWGSFVMIQR